MRLDRIIWILLVSLFLTNCTATRSNVGATLGATTTTGVCVALGVENPYLIAVELCSDWRIRWCRDYVQFRL